MLELLNTTALLSKVPILNLGGPTFTPGKPLPRYKEDRQVIWPAQRREDTKGFECCNPPQVDPPGS